MKFKPGDFVILSCRERKHNGKIYEVSHIQENTGKPYCPYALKDEKGHLVYGAKENQLKHANRLQSLLAGVEDEK